MREYTPLRRDFSEDINRNNTQELKTGRKSPTFDITVDNPPYGGYPVLRENHLNMNSTMLRSGFT